MNLNQSIIQSFIQSYRIGVKQVCGWNQHQRHIQIPPVRCWHQRNHVILYYTMTCECVTVWPSHVNALIQKKAQQQNKQLVLCVDCSVLSQASWATAQRDTKKKVNESLDILKSSCVVIQSPSWWSVLKQQKEWGDQSNQGILQSLRAGGTRQDQYG